MARNKSQKKPTYEAQLLTALKEAMLRLATQDEAQINIHNRQVVFKDPEKVQALIDRYQPIVDAQNGKSPFAAIPVRFNNR